MSTDLIVFGEDWGHHPSSTQHLIKRLAADWQVLWVNSIGMRRPRLNRADLCRIWKKGKAMLLPAQTPVKGAGAPFPVMQPRAIPWPGNPVAGWANGHLLARSINRMVGGQKTSRPLLWTSLPNAVDVLGHVNERAVIYYAGDDFGALAGVDHAPILEAESKLAKRADLIIAASQQIADRFDPDKTKIMHHGIDDTFLKPVKTRPADLPSGPVAGFFGRLSDWIETDLLFDLSQRMPDWTFVFIGDVRTDIRRLKMQNNVRFLGTKRHQDLPAYAQSWDVSLIPFRDTPQIRACNPLKLREYLACGRPVVTTDFPALDGYRDHVSIARTAADFEAAMRAALPASCVSEARQKLVAGETWDARAETLSLWMSALDTR